MSIGSILMWVCGGSAIAITLVQSIIFSKKPDMGMWDCQPINFVVKICVLGFHVGFVLWFFNI